MMRILLLILLLHSAAAMFARVLHVGKGQPYPGISAAIAAAGSGDTVYVHPGIYREKALLINKPLSLIGINYPILDGENQFEVLAVRANHVLIEGLLIRNSGQSSIKEIAGIKLYHTQYVEVRKNRLENNFFGIYGEEIDHCSIKDNVLISHAVAEFEAGDGIHCWKSDSLQISNNQISGFRDGIYFEFVTNSKISGNTSQKNVRYGLHFMFSHNDAYTSNVFQNNGTGVTIMYSHGLRMLNNHFMHNWGNASYAILMKDISDSYMEYNQFEKNTVGIYMEGSNRIQILHNDFINNGWAIKIQASCEGNMIRQNNFSGNSFDVATNGTLVANRFLNNYWDKYEGYDLNRDGKGDVPFHPVSMYGMIVERNPASMMLFRSFMVSLLDKAEKLIPGMTPAELVDEAPAMKRFRFTNHLTD